MSAIILVIWFGCLSAVFLLMLASARSWMTFRGEMLAEFAIVLLLGAVFVFGIPLAGAALGIAP
jgi:hypothetical protein